MIELLDFGGSVSEDLCYVMLGDTIGDLWISVRSVTWLTGAYK